MIREETGFVQRLGQPSLHWRAWHAESRQGVVLRLHGIESHSGWYAESSRQIAEAGYTVYFVERRGSGKSEGGRGDVDHWSTWLHDISAAINDVLWREDVDSLHLMANCWGAKPVLAYAGTYPQRLRSVTVISPALVLRTYYTPLEQFSIYWHSWVKPGHLRRHPVDDAGYFTRDEKRVARIAGDELSLRHCTDRFFFHTRQVTNKLAKLLPRVSVPIHALFGGSDQVLDLPKTHELLRRAPADLLTVRVYPGQWHMLEFEPERERVVQDMIDWLQATDRRLEGVGEDEGDTPLMTVSDLLR